MQKIQHIYTLFEKNNLEFINDLKILCPNNISIAKIDAFMTLTPVYIQLEKISKYVSPYTQQIKNRDEKYFLEHSDKIFEYFGNDNISIFKNMWLTTQDNKQKIWAYLDLYLLLSNKYIQLSKKN